MLNQVILHGRISTDIELRTTTNGKSVSTFNIAVDRDYKNESGNREADFFPCVAWGKLGENINQYFEKGKEILVNGRLQVRSYDSNGTKKYITEIIVEKTDFCGSKSAKNENSGGFGGTESNEDIPF